VRRLAARDAAAATPPRAEVIEARQGGHAYEVRVGPGVEDALAALCAGRDRVALVSCRRVLDTPFGLRVAGALSRRAPAAAVHALPDGERGKTLGRIERAAGWLLRAGATRRSLVVALGGGAVTDAAGFLAATYMRGVDWVAVPTTLLAMVDAAIGGKTAVNLPVAKNAVGAFHPPLAVLADPASLATLPPRELRSGLGEALKYACLRPALLRRAGALAGGGRVDAGLVAECARVKVEVVERDPRERGERKLLNLGHTFGHGVEAAGGFSRFTHGEAVAIGLAFAFRLARRMGRVDDAAVEAVEGLLDAAGLPRRVPAPVARRAVALMAHDKKRTEGGLMWVLPRGAGLAWTVEWDVAVDPRVVGDTVAELIARAPRGGGRR
jgi:3-dehydroquinate synthetase